MDIQLVVFDIAGTTLQDNNDVHQSLEAALQEIGVYVTPEETAPVMGYPKPEAIRMLLQAKLPDAAAISPELIGRVHTAFLQHMLQFYQSHPSVAEKPGATKVFQALRTAGIKIALDTGFDRQTTSVILQRLGWEEQGLIDVSVTSDEVPQGRPSPEMIWRAMQVLGIDSSQAVAKVGDTVADLEEGTGAGCRYVVGITSGACSVEMLKAAPHTHLIDHLAELLSILGLTQVSAI